MTKGESWGAHPQPAPALLHGGADRLDSTCAGGCDPPTAHCHPPGSGESLQGQQSGDACIDPARRDTPQDGAGWKQGEQEGRDMGTESVTQALPFLSHAVWAMGAP